MIDEEFDPVRGRWVPAVPEPFWVHRWFRWRARCACGDLFRDRTGYRAHWKACHGS